MKNANSATPQPVVSPTEIVVRLTYKAKENMFFFLLKMCKEIIIVLNSGKGVSYRHSNLCGKSFVSCCVFLFQKFSRTR
jgi:hypothetical protein